ncbi:uncharacterized protein LOC123924608 isoform X2 [Trifolium pratense]|uniref:uncharacterized protein LOC123924608 isoform X2 n=1 Tax=Trifolium pratense TaxID=57577 RepID=UPI001E690165|nr:uncharacterized protein LOC123924608 isoform X2 [Trifolium pratense]
MVIEAKVSEQKWRYTWESQSHTPTLRLLLFPFSKTLNPSLNLTVHLHSPPSFLTLTSSSSATAPLSLRVPIPNVLLDADFPPTVRSFSDHIEVKLLLLLPVDHPALSALHQSSPLPQPLLMEYDVDKLSSAEKVDFVCRSCGLGLTKKPIRNFVEKPSANWREIADNWFGTCCCSFGGISEKLVMRYVNSHTCAQGMCLLSSTSVTFCKDDLVESNFPERCGRLHECSYVADDFGGDAVSEGAGNFGLDEERTSTCSDAGEANGVFDENARVAHPENGQLSVNLNDAKDVTNIPSCCTQTSTLVDEDGEHHLSTNARKIETVEIVGIQKTLLNGFLEDVFMARSSNLSKDIYWHEFTCPLCTALLGAYPCCEGCAPVDGGVRLFKCYISTCVPVLGSGDIFSKYTVDKMFANRLMECANDESTFRFVVRDLQTKSPVLQIILLNPDTWSCSGNCSGTEDKDPDPKLQLRPVIKVLFSDSEATTESQLRMIEEWAAKNSAEDIFMLTYQIQDLVDALMSAKDMYPPSCASLHGLILSSLQR